MAPTILNDPTYLTPAQVHHALSLRDLTDPRQGHHAIQLIVDGMVAALREAWNCTVRTVRRPPVVAVRDNYDRLGYDAGDVTRARRYTRYLSATTMLRSHTSAELPGILEEYGRPGVRGVDELLVVPGLVYRRDAVDRSHVGEPHQIDLWRIQDGGRTSDQDMLEMIHTVVEAVLPGTQLRLSDVDHPYTLGGRQVDVRLDDRWLELAECGRIHPDVLAGSGLDPDRWSGLALGMGLERALMLRKSIPDIRYLRAQEPRIAEQMRDLSPWQHVSLLPAATRDISVVVPELEDEETLGDRVRTALAEDAQLVESLEVTARTPGAQLPDGARRRLQIGTGQDNLLIRLVLRPLGRTLTADEANDLRNRIYLAVHEGAVRELV